MTVLHQSMDTQRNKTTPSFKLTDEEKHLIKELRSLLEFGYQSGNKILINKRERYFIKATLFQLIGVVHHFSKGILLVAENGLPEVGMSLLRTLLEANISAQYILLDKTESRAKAYYLDDERQRNDQIKHFLEIYKKYPEYESYFSSKKDLKNLKKQLDADIEDFENKHGKLTWPSLFDRARAIDKRRGKPENEFMYRTAYWFFSQFSHLSSRGLNNFLKTDQSGISFMIDPHNEGLDKLLISTYGIYLGFLGSMSAEFGTPTQDELKPYNNKFEQLRNK